MAALSTLIGIAAGPEAGLLGSGWPAVLRTLSSLHALQVRRSLSLFQMLEQTCPTAFGVLQVPRVKPACLLTGHVAGFIHRSSVSP